jgi:hypothetical protein
LGLRHDSRLYQAGAQSSQSLMVAYGWRSWNQHGALQRSLLVNIAHIPKLIFEGRCCLRPPISNAPPALCCAGRGTIRPSTNVTPIRCSLRHTVRQG